MRIAATGVVAVAAAPLFGAISQATVVAPGGFVQAGSYSISGGATFAGDDMGAGGTPQDFEEHAFAGVGSAGADAAFSGASTTNSVNAVATFGTFRAVASNSTLSTEPFPSAQANGGWKDTFTVSNSALTGQGGFMTFQVRARGSEQASGISGGTVLSLAAYKNNVRLSANPYFSAGNSDVISTTDQYGRWGLATFGNPNTDSRVVDGVVTFSVPIVFGQSFSLGVYSLLIAGLRSSGGFGTPCTATADFSGSGVTWNGITGILNSSGTPVGGSTIVTGSGVDWTNPVTTCAADLDDGSGAGTPDGGVDINDLLYFLVQFEGGDVSVDLDNGSGRGFPDGGVDINDLIFFLTRFEQGC